MAVFRLSFLLQVGLVIGSNLRYAERSAHRGEGTREAAGGAQAPRRRLHHPPAVTAELPQKVEERLPKAVTAFLHSGDSTTLQHANCSRRYELPSLRGRSHAAPQRSVSGALDAVLHAANFLNMILQANRSREQNLRRDVEWYHALVRSILEGDPRIHRAVLTFGPDASAQGAAVLLQATRAGEEVVLRDLSAVAQRLHNRTADSGWYHDLKDAKKKPGFRKRVLSQDLRSAGGSVSGGESFLPDRAHVRWSAPYLECEDGTLVPRWLLTLSAAFYGLKDDLEPEFRGVVRVDVNLQDVDIDQCSSDGWFAGTHRCNATTMECLPLRGHGFVLDKYSCRCKAGFYHPNRVALNSFARTGRDAASPESGPNADEGSSNDCLPCQQGCAYCKDDTPCVAREDGALRLAVLSFQCLCLLVVFLSMVLVYHFRRNKSIRASGLVLLEAILCGALLLYFPVGILYFQPSVFRCVLLRWVRLLGFATVYGTLTLKLYRVLKVFLSRTAQRIPYMTSWRVLRLLAVILLVVSWFLVAWTAAVCQHPHRTWALIGVGYTPDGLQFSMCLLDRWDYMTAVAEFLFLLWAVYLCYAVRTVPSAFHEPRYMAIAVHNELVLSAIFYVIRFTLVQELHPDWMLLLFFTHTHLTVTVTLGLLLVPKFLFAGTHVRDDMASEAYEDELDMGRSGSYLNSSITSAWSEHSLDPEDIREELKKLYSQLEIYKRKKMLANNPHLPKKRSSKKGLGRSLMRRITEIPESVHRQCSREDKEAGEHAGSRNSVCALKKNPVDAAHAAKPAKEETLKSKVFSLKKSHSSYDHVRDQSEDGGGSAGEAEAAEGALLDALMGKKAAKKSSENIPAPSESAESVPLVCKSASAHNLSADKRAVQAGTSVLQKSLSVIASAREKTLGLSSRGQSSEDGGRKAQPRSAGRAAAEPRGQAQPRGHAQPQDHAQPRGHAQPGGHAQPRGHAQPQNHAQPGGHAQPQGHAQPRGHAQPQGHAQPKAPEGEQAAAKGRAAKQPLSNQPTSCPHVAKGKDLYDLSEVCPWEVEDLPTPSENKVQKHVSIAPKESTTVHGGAAKGGRAPQPKPKGSEQSAEAQQTAAARAEAGPREGHSTGPEPAKQQGLSQASRAAPDTAKSRRADVCPWDFQDPPKTADPSADTAKQRKSPSPVEARGRSAPPDPPRPGGSLQIPPARADVCPWEYDNAAASPSSGQRTPSPSQSSKAREAPSTKKDPPPRTAEKEKPREAKDKSKPPEKRQQKLAEVCPWDVDSSQEMVEKRRSATLGASKAKPEDVCPWDVDSSQETVEKRRSATLGASKAKPADVCPWDFQDAPEKTDRAAKASDPVAAGGLPSAAKKADICPWDFEDSTSSKKA